MMYHQSILSSFLPIVIIVLIICNSSTCRATRLLALKTAESPTLPNSDAPPLHQDGPFPKLQWQLINFPRHEQFSTQPNTAKFPPWPQVSTKAEEPTPPVHHSLPKFEEPKLLQKPENKILTTHPNVPSYQKMHPILKPKWSMPKLPLYPAVPKYSISKLTPNAEEPTPTKHQMPALPPLHEIPSLLSPEQAPISSVALAPAFSSNELA